MVDDVMQQKTPEGGNARHAEDNVRPALQGPGRRQFRVASRSERATNLSDVSVERLEYFGACGPGLRSSGRAGEVVRLGVQNLTAPVRQLRQVAGQSAKRERPRVGGPAERVVRRAFEHTPRRGHLVVELDDERLALLHVSTGKVYFGRRLGRGRRVEIRVLLKPEQRGRDVRRESTAKRVVFLYPLVVPQPFGGQPILSARQLVHQTRE